MLFKKFCTFIVSFQIYSFQFTQANEPVCSKFPYEEQMLEKMIRTEIKVETMANEMKVTQERVMDTLSVLTGTVKDFTERFKDLRRNNTADMLGISESFEKKINVLKRLIQATQTNLSHEIENQRRSFIEQQGKIEQPAVGFHVNHLIDVNPKEADAVLVFDSIITNEGSGYDTSTEIFTAPVGGLYQFTVHICTASSSNSIIGIIHADKVISKKFSYGSGDVICSSLEGVVKVKSGERVMVKFYRGRSSYKLFQNSNAMNTFSGVLINI